MFKDYDDKDKTMGVCRHPYNLRHDDYVLLFGLVEEQGGQYD